MVKLRLGFSHARLAKSACLGKAANHGSELPGPNASGMEFGRPTSLSSDLATIARA